MKTVLLTIILGIYISFNALSQIMKPFYDYQIGFETSLGGAGENHVPFMFGISGGAFYRIKNHQFGARYSNFSEIGVFLNNASEYQTINAYYRYLYSNQFTTIGIQLGGGHFKNEDYRHSNHWHNYNLEASVYFSLTKLGNGMHIRPFFAWNPHHQFIGFNLGGTFGGAWRK